MAPTNMRGLVTVLAVTLTAAAACASTRTRFEPYSATSESGQTVLTAVEAHEGDIPALTAAGAEIVGTVTAGGNGYASQGTVEASAAHEAALHGGTHYIVGVELSDVSVYQTPTTATTIVSGNTAYTTVNPGASMPIVRYSTGITVLRVRPENWSRLAPSLRPVLGKDPPPRKTAGTCVQNRNVSCR